MGPEDSSSQTLTAEDINLALEKISAEVEFQRRNPWRYALIFLISNLLFIIGALMGFAVAYIRINWVVSLIAFGLIVVLFVLQDLGTKRYPQSDLGHIREARSNLAERLGIPADKIADLWRKRKESISESCGLIFLFLLGYFTCLLSWIGVEVMGLFFRNIPAWLITTAVLSLLVVVGLITVDNLREGEFYRRLQDLQDLEVHFQSYIDQLDEEGKVSVPKETIAKIGKVEDQQFVRRALKIAKEESFVSIEELGEEIEAIRKKTGNQGGSIEV